MTKNLVVRNDLKVDFLDSPMAKLKSRKNLEDKPKRGPLNDLFTQELNQIYQLNLSNLLTSGNLSQSRLKKPLSDRKAKRDSSVQSPKTELSRELTRSLIDISLRNEKRDKSLDKLDQNRFKSSLYMSYLNYGSTNPFKSNYDIINKTNPEFYKQLAKNTDQTSLMFRFDRTNSSLSLLNHSLDYKKFLSHIDANTREALSTEAVLNANTNAGGEQLLDSSVIFSQTTNKLPENSNPLLSSRESTILSKANPLASNSAKNLSKISEVNSTQSSLSQLNENSKTKFNLLQNQFLNYRNEKINVNNKESLFKTCKFF